MEIRTSINTKNDYTLDEIKKMNIYEKMLHIQNELTTVNKNLIVGEGTSKYKAVGEADVLKAVKVLENKYRVFSYPSNREILESEMFTTETTYKGQTRKKNNIFSRIKTNYTFINIDKPEEKIETITFAEGIDSQDKGSGKAMTYSDKYALMKTYKIITGEDPDQNGSTDNYIPNYISQNQSNTINTPISKTMIEALNKAIENANIQDETVEKVLNKYGYSSTNEIQAINYKKIVDEFKNLKK